MSYSFDMANSDATSQAAKFGDMNVGGDRGLRYVLYGLLGVVGLGVLIWGIVKLKGK